MRFVELPSGARFEFEGRTYTKTNALTANDESGKTRLIPRSATIRPMDGVQAPKSAHKETELSAEQVRGALDHYHARCIALLDRVPQEMRGDLRDELDAARADAEKCLSPSAVVTECV